MEDIPCRVTDYPGEGSGQIRFYEDEKGRPIDRLRIYQSFSYKHNDKLRSLHRQTKKYFFIYLLCVVLVIFTTSKRRKRFITEAGFVVLRFENLVSAPFNFKCVKSLTFSRYMIFGILVIQNKHTFQTLNGHIYTYILDIGSIRSLSLHTRSVSNQRQVRKPYFFPVSPLQFTVMIF